MPSRNHRYHVYHHPHHHQRRRSSLSSPTTLAQMNELSFLFCFNKNYDVPKVVLYKLREAILFE
jgi:hypothetical protein